MHNLRLRRLMSVVAVVGVTIVIGIPVMAQQPPPPGGPGGRAGGFGGGGRGGPRGGGRQLSIAALPVATLDAIVKLKPDQKKKVVVIHDSYVAAMAAGRPQPGQMPDRTAMQKLRDTNTQSNAAIEALLTPTQMAKLDVARKEMGLYRMAGIPIGLYGQIHLTDAQKSQLQALQPAAPSGGGRPDFRAMMAVMQSNRAKAKAILTPAQNAMVEKYIQEHPNERGFGGPGGGRGGRGGFAGAGGPGGPGPGGARP